MYFHHLLITTDLSEASNRAVDYVAKRIPAEVEQITLLHVIANWPFMVNSGEYILDPQTIEAYNTDMHATSKEELNRIAEKFFLNKNINRTVLSSSLSAATEICEYAKANRCDLIIMGSHGVGLLENLLIGSTVQKVIKSAPCPVLVVPVSEATPLR